MRTIPSLNAALALVLALGLGACDSLDQLLEVEAPSRVIAQDLDDPRHAGLLVQSSWNEFRCAFTHYINAGGLVGWELRSLQNGGTRPYYDARSWSSGGWSAGSYARADCESGTTAHYITLSASRWLADEVLGRLDEWGVKAVPEKREWEAELATWSGYSHFFMGVSMCSVTFDVGPEHPPEYALEQAIDRFDRSIAAARETGRDDILNVARVGKARTLLNLGRTAEAAAVAAEVPEGFRYEMPYSSINNSTRNRQYRINHDVEDAGVGVLFHNMNYQDVPDPRVPVRNMERDVAGYGVELWHQLKYTSYDDPIPLARWEEAQLILAEAALEEGRLQDAVDIINIFHKRARLPEFQSSDPAEILDLIIYNRQAELFLESHHWEDMQRYGLPYYPAAGEPFPMGGVYGSQTCFPLPDEEVANNPNISG